MGDPTPTPTPATITVTVEFSGGLEMLFDNVSSHKVSIPAHNADGFAFTVGDLIPWLCENLMKDSRKELFVLDGGV